MIRIARSRLLFLVLSMSLVVPILVTSLGGSALAQGRDGAKSGDSLYKYLTVFMETLRLVRNVYVEETDLRSLMSGALDGATDALDPFSVYVPAEEIENYKRARKTGTQNSGMLVLKERGVAFVVSVDEGSPAAQADVRSGDIVSELQGHSTRDMPMWQITTFLAPEPGQSIEMELIRGGNSMDVEFQTAAYEHPAPTLTPVENKEGISVLRIPSLEKASGDVVSRLLDQVPAGSKLLVDLRSASAGDPERAYSVADLFVDGELGSLLNGEAETLETFKGSSARSFKGQLGVLVDRGTLGAAEVLASVLHQGGARLLGEPTFGHAGKSKLVALGGGAYIDLTESFYAGPNGERLNEGLKPDQIVRRRFDFEEDESTDTVLDKAIELFEEPFEAETEDKVAA